MIHALSCLQDGTPPSQAPDPENAQPHIVVILHDDYNQYFIAVEQIMCMECTDVATALFYLVASHYVLNLSYHDKIQEVFRFIQERIMDIESAEKGKASKSPVSSSYVNGITSMFDSWSRGGFETETVYDSE